METLVSFICCCLIIKEKTTLTFTLCLNDTLPEEKKNILVAHFVLSRGKNNEQDIAKKASNYFMTINNALTGITAPSQKHFTPPKV